MACQLEKVMSPANIHPLSYDPMPLAAARLYSLCHNLFFGCTFVVIHFPNQGIDC